MLRAFNLYRYHIRKARAITEGVKSLTDYRSRLRQARNKAVMNAHMYHDKIQDQFLQNHKQEMKIRHLNNQALFRKHIAHHGYILSQNITKWKKDDQQLNQRLNKFINQQQLKKINRQRIKKILQYESQNYWLNSQNVDQKMTNEMIFPSYLGSNEFYHKLQLQSLAYETYDYSLLDDISNTQKIIQQKNKLLIPLFKQVRRIAGLVKTNPLQKLLKNYHNQILALKNQKKQFSSNQQLHQTLKQKQQELQKSKKQLLTQTQIRKYLKNQLSLITQLIKSWQQYTQILGMSSNQILIRLKKQQNEPNMKKIKKELMYQSLKSNYSGFISLKQQDSQQFQLSFKQYVEQINKKHKKTNQQINDYEKTKKISYIQSLIEDEQVQEVAQKIQKKFSQKNKEKIINFDLFDTPQLIEPAKKVSIPLHLKTPSETTIMIETFKQIYKQDTQLIEILNEIGQANILYPKLFKKVMDVS